jgi:hypothetical protein
MSDLTIYLPGIITIDISSTGKILVGSQGSELY